MVAGHAVTENNAAATMHTRMACTIAQREPTMAEGWSSEKQLVGKHSDARGDGVCASGHRLPRLDHDAGGKEEGSNVEGGDEVTRPKVEMRWPATHRRKRIRKRRKSNSSGA